jgi:hypothetical protein
MENFLCFHNISHLKEMSDLLHGAEIREGYLVSGDATVMAFTRHESHGRNNFILIDVEDKKVFCDPSVGKWLPGAVNSHLTKLSKTIADKQTGATPPESSPLSSSKKSKQSTKGSKR